MYFNRYVFQLWMKLLVLFYSHLFFQDLPIKTETMGSMGVSLPLTANKDPDDPVLVSVCFWTCRLDNVLVP